jgi:hypothetical protein
VHDEAKGSFGQEAWRRSTPVVVVVVGRGHHDDDDDHHHHDDHGRSEKWHTVTPCLHVGVNIGETYSFGNSAVDSETVRCSHRVTVTVSDCSRRSFIIIMAKRNRLLVVGGVRTMTMWLEYVRQVLT